jgi:hypothetical protein
VAFGLLQIPVAITFLIAYHFEGLPIFSSNISWALIVGFVILGIIVISKVLGTQKPEFE